MTKLLVKQPSKTQFLTMYTKYGIKDRIIRDYYLSSKWKSSHTVNRWYIIKSNLTFTDFNPSGLISQPVIIELHIVCKTISLFITLNYRNWKLVSPLVPSRWTFGVFLVVGGGEGLGYFFIQLDEHQHSPWRPFSKNTFVFSSLRTFGY